MCSLKSVRWSLNHRITHPYGKYGRYMLVAPKEKLAHYTLFLYALPSHPIRSHFRYLSHRLIGRSVERTNLTSVYDLALLPSPFPPLSYSPSSFFLAFCGTGRSSGRGPARFMSRPANSIEVSYARLNHFCFVMPAFYRHPLSHVTVPGSRERYWCHEWPVVGE